MRTRYKGFCRNILSTEGNNLRCRREENSTLLKNIMNRITNEGKRVGGVVWHTQGSGKSLTMVMLAKAIALELSIENHKIILDRIDLDDQIYKTSPL
ncbi:MAG: DEAD/DEAH box helicase family protein [Candidatus Brocadiaceae bacterium]